MISTKGPILLFDGTCVLCHAFFKWVIKNDKSKLFSFATLQSDFGQKIIHDHQLTTDADSVILFDQGKVYIFSEAALKVLILLDGYVKWPGKIGLLFPRFLRDGVYTFIARNRYKWFGVKACIIPDQELRGRFKN